MARTRIEGRPARFHWGWLLLAIVVGWLLFARSPVGPRGGGGGGPLYDPARPVASVTYQGAHWTPQGTPVSLADDRVVVVGRTSDGYALYARRELGGGGGGVAGSPLYLRAKDGRYQPLYRR